MAGMILLDDGHLVIVAKGDTFRLPVGSLADFEGAGSVALEPFETLKVQRSFTVELSNVSGYFNSPNSQDDVFIHFDFGLPDDIVIGIRKDLLVPILQCLVT